MVWVFVHFSINQLLTLIIRSRRIFDGACNTLICAIFTLGFLILHMTTTLFSLRAMRTSALRCLFVASLAASGLAHAQVSVYPMEVRVTGGQPSITTIDVTSQSAETSYVTVAVKEVLNPREPNEKEVPIDSMQPDQLVVLPHKFILAPHARKKIRLVFMRPVDHERVFRVAVEGDKGVDIDVPTGASGVDGKKVTSKVSMQIQWAPLVRVLPLAPHVAYSARRANGAYLLRNDGNVRFMVRALVLCPAGSKEVSACKPVSDKGNAEGNLYPGSEVKLPDGNGDGAALHFEIVSQEGDDVRQVQADELLIKPVK